MGDSLRGGEVIYGWLPGYRFARLGETVIIDAEWWQGATPRERTCALLRLYQREQAQRAQWEARPASLDPAALAALDRL